MCIKSVGRRPLRQTNLDAFRTAGDADCPVGPERATWNTPTPDSIDSIESYLDRFICVVHHLPIERIRESQKPRRVEIDRMREQVVRAAHLRQDSFDQNPDPVTQCERLAVIMGYEDDWD
jgi:hypothetical protein